jgi:hypothetical protein
MEKKMKKIAIISILAIVLSTTTVFAKINEIPVNEYENSSIGGSFKILNDTDNEVQIHTGSGFVELNKGSSTSLTCEAVKEIRSANKGKKGGVIFTVDDSMCGKTIKLSKYL